MIQFDTYFRPTGWWNTSNEMLNDTLLNQCLELQISIYQWLVVQQWDDELHQIFTWKTWLFHHSKIHDGWLDLSTLRLSEFLMQGEPAEHGPPKDAAAPPLGRYTKSTWKSSIFFKNASVINLGDACMCFVLFCALMADIKILNEFDISATLVFSLVPFVNASLLPKFCFTLNHLIGWHVAWCFMFISSATVKTIRRYQCSKERSNMTLQKHVYRNAVKTDRDLPPPQAVKCITSCDGVASTKRGFPDSRLIPF